MGQGPSLPAPTPTPTTAPSSTHVEDSTLFWVSFPWLGLVLGLLTG